MRKTFLTWLLVFMATAFMAAFAVSFYVQTNQASENAKTLILLKVDDVEKQLELNQQNLADIRAESDANALAKARAFAQMLAIDPELVSQTEELEKIRKMLDVDELHVSDGKGILIGGTMESYIGYDFASDDQSSAFLPAITEKDFELAQDPQPKGINKEVFQYVGVARIDTPGIVQIGYRPEKLSHAMEVADIKNLATGFRVGKSGSVMIVDQMGEIVSVANPALLGQTLVAYGFEENSIKDSEGSFIAEITGKKMLCAYKTYQGYLIIGQLPAEEMYLNRNSTITLLLVFNIILFAVIFALIAKLVQIVVINGIYKVNGSLGKITEGNLNEVVNVCTNEEFQSLSHGINTMVDALKAAITEAASRIDSELAFAKAIQLSALPSNFPAFPDREEFDVFAGMNTAKEVGGDFYDFFMINEEKLGFVIADVSGKGIPAALFMMVSKSLIKNYALAGLSVCEILSKANNTLCENNEANMFVTVFIGILDLKTGKLNYASAGHNPPLIQKEQGKFEWLSVKPCFVLAGMEDVPYAEQQIMLSPGDRLFLYTDGVTEAMNKVGQLYSDGRLHDLLKGMPPELDLTEMLAYIKADVDCFADGAEQADDITMLALEYRGTRENH
ncbi:MAG: SpoIIE family protein phosphatase [Syntrophomonas sp.]|nr:SpoIIE family protein phosphatase [Syntrophomonas sp.]